MTEFLPKKRCSIATLCGLAFLAAACSSDPAYQVITSDANSVSYTWNSDDMTLEEVSELAKAHCAQYGQPATLESDEASGDDNESHTTIFKC